MPDEIPHHPDWTTAAACRGMFATTEGDDVFFDYGKDKDKIRRAKEICASCPVWRECRRYNMEVPVGIFGGLTERERWKLLGRGTRRPTDREAHDFFTRAGRFPSTRRKSVSRA